MKIEIVLRGNDVVRKALFFPEKSKYKSMAILSYVIFYTVTSMEGWICRPRNS